MVEILQISDPFLMVDEVVWCPKKRTATGKKEITENEWFYKCHFLDGGVMPGTLQTEAILQTTVAACCLDLYTDAKQCLVNKIIMNFTHKIESRGILTIKSQIEAEKNGLICANSTLHFNKTKTATGSIRFLLQGSLGVR
ncbi:FabA/FabZ family ACP-dehydratase [Alphaproteobacteria bacterium]|nr:FabA/FabZ family ACP-dehydratase [Alphaproteobacteria bacterium]